MQVPLVFTGGKPGSPFKNTKQKETETQHANPKHNSCSGPHDRLKKQTQTKHWIWGSSRISQKLAAWPRDKYLHGLFVGWKGARSARVWVGCDVQGCSPVAQAGIPCLLAEGITAASMPIHTAQALSCGMQPSPQASSQALFDPL